MTDVRDALADHARGVLLVLGVALVLLGAVGPGPVGAVAVLGVVTLIVAVLLDDLVESLVRSSDPDDEPPADPVSALRERYVQGELDREEFERRVERLLDPDGEPGTEPTGDRGDREVLAESAGAPESSEGG